MKQPLRILHVIGMMNRGGAEAVIMNLYRQIDREKIQFDFVVHISEHAAYDDEITKLGGKIFHCPKFTARNVLKYRKWWRAFFSGEGSQYRIVHGHIGSTAAIYLEEAKRIGAFTIAHSHNTYGKFHIKSIPYRILSYRTRYVADYFFMCSYLAGADRFGKKVAEDASRSSILNNAIKTVDYDYNAFVRKEIRDDLNIPYNSIVIGHVGRFAEAKNHTFLLDVFNEYRKTNENALLMLVGDGELKESIIRKITNLHLNDRAIMTGIRSDVNRLIQAMDVMCFPSLFEGLGVALVEAQTSGLPCVISDRVPEDVQITTGLIKVVGLSEPIQRWTATIDQCVKQPRMSHRDEVISKGYDIETTAKWLEGFYIEHAR